MPELVDIDWAKVDDSVEDERDEQPVTAILCEIHLPCPNFIGFEPSTMVLETSYSSVACLSGSLCVEPAVFGGTRAREAGRE